MWLSKRLFFELRIAIRVPQTEKDATNERKMARNTNKNHPQTDRRKQKRKRKQSPKQDWYEKCSSIPRSLLGGFSKEG
jgi:hypothetical protein